MTLLRLSLFLWTLAAQILLIFAQSFTSPSSWRKPNITTAPETRIALATGAIDKTVSMINANAQYDGGAFGTAGTVYSQMAELDLLTNQTKYKDQLKKFFSLTDSSKPDFGDEFLNYALIYGYAATRAYTAYKDVDFLNWAVANWEFGRLFTLSDADVKAGTSVLKNFPIQAQCQGITMAGGAFHATDTPDTGLNALSTGYFLINSALLAEATSNQTYLDAATQSADFIHSHLFNVQNVVQDTISARQNDSCAVGSGTGPYNSGLMIEGLAILASLTKKAETRDLLYETIAAAVNNSAWQGADGIVSTGDGKTGDLNLIRGMVAAYNRNTTNYNLRSFLKDYLGVQYNAVLDQAASGVDNIYGASWVGPPSTTYSPDAQSISLSVLLGGMTLQNDTVPSDSTGSGSNNAPNPDPEPKTKTSLAGPIAGGVIGGLVLASLVAIFVFVRQRRKRKLVLLEDASFPPLPTPFTITQLSVSAPSTSPSDTGHNRQLSREYLEKQSRLNRPLPPASGMSKPWPPPPPQSQSSYGVQESERRTGSSVADTHSVAPSISIATPQNLPTEELVRLLNERLQGGPEWDTEETPPEYHHAPSTR